MRRLKLCFLGWGNHVHLERWATYFATVGHDVSVLSVSGKGTYPPSVRQYVLKLARRRPVIADAELRLLLWRLQPDLVHVHWAHFAVPTVRAWSGPLAVTAWGSDIYRRDHFSRAQWSAMAVALQRASFVTCDSEHLARELMRECQLPERVVKIIQWGVNTEDFAPGPSRLTARLGLSGRLVVLSPRNFTPLYNQDAVVDAFALARSRVSSAFLLMKSYGGDKSYKQSIAERIDRLGLNEHCTVLETLPYAEMPDLYRAARVSVSIPSSDATPVSLLEAMACGSLPLASDLPSLREWIVDGENGYLVPLGDVPAVARAMVEGLTDEQFYVRATARNRNLVLERASQSLHMSHCEELYRQAVANTPGERSRAS